MLINSNEEMIVQGNLGTLADTMGYKAVGGAITFAIQALELKNYIAKQNDKYKVLL